MDTSEALKQAMQAVKDAGIPEELWATALPLALADIRAAGTPTPVETDKSSADAKTSAASPAVRTPKKPAARRTAAAGGGSASSAPSVLTGLPDQAELFEKVSAETGVSTADLGDVFHVENGELEIKVISKNIGSNKSAGTKNLAALLGGLVLAGTGHTKIPFKDISTLCKAKHCHDSNNGASYIKATPGFAAVGSGASQALTSKTGWQDEFSKAVARVLGKSDHEN